MSPQPWFIVAGLLFMLAMIGGLLVLAVIAWLAIHVGVAALTWGATQPPSPGRYPSAWPADPRSYWPPPYHPPPGQGYPHLDQPPVARVIGVRRTGQRYDPYRG